MYRLYILGGIFETFLFFLLLNRISLGFNLSLSRLFQGLLILSLCLGLKFYKPKDILAGRSKYLTWGLFLFVIYSTGLGFLDNQYEVSSSVFTGSDRFSEFITLSLRPIIEIVVIIYIYWYFVNLSNYIINTAEKSYKLLYFYIIISFISIAVGYLDFVIKIISDGQFTLVARHIAEYFDKESGVSNYEARFHGFYGEPRDSVPSLLALLAILKLIEVECLTQSIKIRKVIYIIIFLSILGTYSVSALVILPIVVIIIPFAILNGLIKLRFKSFVLAIALLIIFIILIIYYANIETSRLGYYLFTYQNILEKNSLSNFTFDERTQLPNILPLIEFLKSCSTYLTYHCFIGHGLGSAAFLNANLEFGGLTNPFSDFIRLTYDIGIFGLFMYVAYFMALIKRVSLHRVHQLKGSEIQIFWTILTFCACLAHRSFAIWLLLMFMYQFSVRTELDKKKIYSKLNKVLIFKIIYKDVKDNAGRGTEKNIIT